MTGCSWAKGTGWSSSRCRRVLRLWCAAAAAVGKKHNSCFLLFQEHPHWFHEFLMPQTERRMVLAVQRSELYFHSLLCQISAWRVLTWALLYFFSLNHHMFLTDPCSSPIPSSLWRSCPARLIQGLTISCQKWWRHSQFPGWAARMGFAISFNHK